MTILAAIREWSKEASKKMSNEDKLRLWIKLAARINPIDFLERDRLTSWIERETF